MTNGTTNSALAALAPEARVTEADAEAIYLLLEERIRRYTMGSISMAPTRTTRPPRYEMMFR